MQIIFPEASMGRIELTQAQQEQLMREALREAERGMADGEAPIGCVVALYNGGDPKVVARGYNRNNGLKAKVAHAEIVTFMNASAAGGTPSTLRPDAKGIILVSSLEPCVMCLGAAMEVGVETVLYGLKAPADNGTTRIKPPESPGSSAPQIIGDILAGESRRLLAQWLEGKEGTEQAKFVEQLLALTEDAD